MSVRLFHIIFLLICSSLTFAQNLENAINYTVKDGLPSNTVYCVEQDDTGFIWFGTDAGLSRFDGYEFKNYGLEDGLPDVEILNFYKDLKGRIWFYTLNGKVGFLEDGKIHNSENTVFLKNIDFDSRITSISENGGFIAIASYLSGVWFFNETDFYYKIETDGYVNNIFKNNDSWILVRKKYHELEILNLYINAISSGVEVDTIKQYTQVSFSPITYGEPFDNNIVLATSSLTDHKITFLDVTNGNFSRVSTNGSRIYNIKKIEEGVFILTNEGVKKLDVASRKSEIIMSIPHATNIISDFQDNYWITSLNNGVFFNPPKHVFKYKKDTILSCQQLSKGSEDLYITYNSFNVGKIKSDDSLKLTPEFISESNIYDMYVDSLNNIWTCNPPGLVKNNNQIISKPIGIGISGSIRDDYILFQPQRGEFHLMNLFNEELNLIQINSKSKIYDFIDLGDSRLFVASANESFIWDLKKSRIFELPEFKRISIVRIIEDSFKKVWFATAGNGLIRIEKEKILELSREEILEGRIKTTSRVYDNLLVIENVVYASSPEGLDRIMFSNNGIVSSNRIDDSNGLDLSHTNDIESIGDNVFLAKSSGLFFFNKFQTFKESSNFPIVIDAVFTADSLYNSTQDGKLEFPHDIGTIQIISKAINFRFQKSVEYQFRLLLSERDFDQKWNSTFTNEVTFSNLTPSNYEFQVRARTKNSEWTQPTSISFTIRPAYWQTLWFKIIVALLIVLVIYYSIHQFNVVRDRKANLRKEKLISDLKALKAQINPHFLFNSLNSIQSFVLEKENQLAEEYLVKYGKLMRNILNHSEELIIPLSEELNSINIYVDLEKLRLINELEFVVNIDPSLNPDIEKIPSMVIQPLIENAIWHGIQPLNKKGKIELSIFNDEENIVVLIKDNGVGLRKPLTLSKKPKGFQLVKDRITILNSLKHINSSFEIYSDDSGTSVKFSYPIELN